MMLGVPAIRIHHISFVLFAGMHLACALVILYPPTWSLLALAGAGYVVRMWGITVGFHRYFAHRSFKTSRAFQLLLAFIGGTAMQNGPLWWASWHRRHHKHADEEGDPHSPRLIGFWRAHIGWVFDGRHGATDLSNVQDLSRFPELRFLDTHTWLPLLVYGLGCWALLGAGGLVWGMLVSTLAENHATFLINSLAHRRGTRRFETPDTSRNNAVLALLTLGEGWHNNHHHQMSCARQGLTWWELDVGYLSLKVLSWLGIVWGVRGPAPSVIREMRELRNLRHAPRQPGATAD